jgi:hypothetical protein
MFAVSCQIFDFIHQVYPPHFTLHLEGWRKSRRGKGFIDVIPFTKVIKVLVSSFPILTKPY